jgi:pimeloyl-ACP methyl ester carboxylesterase
MNSSGRLLWLLMLTGYPALSAAERTDGFADSHGVKIHYVTQGSGPLLVLIHGFPDYWYTWRAQMAPLAEHFQVVAIDQRGYNKSDQPAGVENYALPKLVEDVRQVIRHFRGSDAIIVGHDWGGAVAWSFAMTHPEWTRRLIILNTPHPNGLRRELATNPRQRQNSAYARRFQQPDAESDLTAEALAGWVEDTEARAEYIEAFRRSSLQAMLNYYRANYPREPYRVPREVLPKVRCPVLMIHGLQDEALLPAGLNDTWEWLEEDLTLVTLPRAGHFVQHDAADTVNRILLRWLAE